MREHSVIALAKRPLRDDRGEGAPSLLGVSREHRRDRRARARHALEQLAEGALAERAEEHREVDARAELARAVEATRAELEPPDEVYARWQRWLADDRFWPTQIALVHGDLHPAHMLLGEDGALVGILDWTEARVSDPSTGRQAR